MNESPMMESWPRLPVHQYRLEFAVDHPLKLPPYAGSAWRGAFGHALKKTVCVVRHTPCEQCLLFRSCAYPYIFETPLPPQATKMRKYTRAPHPFVLQIPKQEEDEIDLYVLNLSVFGHGQRFFPYMLHALQKAGLEGVGGVRQRFELQQVQKHLPNDVWETIYQAGELSACDEGSIALSPPEMPQAVTLVLLTPMRLKLQGHNLNAENFQFGAFFGTLLRRISMLTYFHTDTPLETDFAGLTKRAKEIDFNDKDLRWFDWKRYSSRQDAEMNMGGVIGELTLDMSGMDDFWPYLWLGQWTHVGKATSMGLGKYSIRTASLPECR